MESATAAGCRRRRQAADTTETNSAWLRVGEERLNGEEPPNGAKAC